MPRWITLCHAMLKYFVAYSIALLNSSNNSHKGGRSTHDTGIENVWREYNTMVKYHFLKFRNSEFLGTIKTLEKCDLWVLNFVCIKTKNDQIKKMMTYCNDNPLSSECSKSTAQIFTISNLKIKLLIAWLNLTRLIIWRCVKV